MYIYIYILVDAVVGHRAPHLHVYVFRDGVSLFCKEAISLLPTKGLT